ncbi:DUF1190 family protein [Pectobacteriaceae bacterium CE70]|uniref:UPF0441 protein CWC46_00310 n=1 Tax=Serratia sp. (strain ATCC 39006) TaxID=104623 RepID=A0A2I5T1H0_SERS3|nr:DUF1190 family protein [Serratia sp. ATCC 39006]WJV62965.1 DUF1190 family protein [Pectobacteriaceae bacterium C52]WJV67305.1 DUF1190 family protein [Pectobacteriaceae bacterium CE70]WJY11285.1 DUF1190 family protein [Pectobacteriaceae bacterium C80]AUG98401.1 hypothetical protein CWC46_00310 [Serratia sp. ATCC 39006]AUH02716.1 hypothetical protein Ser39006_000310 [Serratia sp. ATCC 39006]
MKRTQNISHDHFRKEWRNYHIAPIALAVSSVFLLAGCEKADETVSLYQNADDCTRANPSMKEQCLASYNNALKEAEKTAPKYATREDCVAEFGEAQCTQVPAQAGMAAQPQQSGSFWMPLMAGYMMGRLMGGGSYAQQPLFTSRAPNSPANGKFFDASGKDYGKATTGRTITVPKTALAPKPPTTTTITRGGFGERITKQNTLRRTSSSTKMYRSMGG